MPPTIPNKFYKTTVNGLPVYEILPGTNTPYGYSEITRDEFISGQQNELNRLRSLSVDTTKDQSAVQAMINGAMAIQEIGRAHV